MNIYKNNTNLIKIKAQVSWLGFMLCTAIIFFTMFIDISFEPNWKTDNSTLESLYFLSIFMIYILLVSVHFLENVFANNTKIPVARKNGIIGSTILTFTLVTTVAIQSHVDNYFLLHYSLFENKEFYIPMFDRVKDVIEYPSVVGGGLSIYYFIQSLKRGEIPMLQA